jgi:hypothetical protein
MCLCSNLPLANCTAAYPATTTATAATTTATTTATTAIPTDKDNTPLIAGAVVGSLLFLAVVALVVFFFRQRISKAKSPSFSELPES